MRTGWESWDWAWRRIRGYLTNAYKYLTDRSQMDGTRLFPVVPSNRTRGNEKKPQLHTSYFSYYENMRNKFLILRVTVHWNRFPRRAVKSHSLEKFKTCLDAFTCNIIWGTSREFELVYIQRSFTKPVILWFWDSMKPKFS